MYIANMAKSVATTASKFTTFLQIMAFYFVLSFILFPMGAYYLVKRDLMAAGHGWVIGSVISIILWHFYGRHLL